MTESPARIAVAVEGAVARILIQNRARRNALTMPMWADLARAVVDLDARSDVSVLTISGDGDDFSTGIDLSTAAPDAESMSDPDNAVASAEAAIIDCSKPVLALVRGYCVGGGLLLALACDLRISATTAKFGITPAKIGAMYPARSIRRLVEHVGPSAAKRMLYTADFSDAHEALRIGLVDEVVEQSEVNAVGDAMARTIASRSQLTVRAVKDYIETSLTSPELVDERERLWTTESSLGMDGSEGAAAFAEKRRPQFEWRAPTTPIPPRSTLRTTGRR